MKVIEEIIVLLVSMGLFQMLFGIIIKWVFNKRSNLLDKTQKVMLKDFAEHTKELISQNKLIKVNNELTRLQNEKLDNVLIEIKKSNERELERSKQIGAIINEEL